MKTVEQPRFVAAISLLLILVLVFAVSIIGFGLPPFIPLIISISIVIGFGRIHKFSFEQIQTQMLSGLKTGLAPLFLFLLIGMLIALWMATNVIPTMLWAGFNIANPQWFLPTTLLLMSMVGTMIGSAFTSIATVGVALMGIGLTLGFSPELLAGAIISGAIFGDKSSPLSDSTNLASSIAETDLFAHIKNMMWTTLPSLFVSLVLFTVLGMNHTATTNVSALNELQTIMTPTWLALVPLVLLVGMTLKRIPAIITLLVNILVTSAMFLVHNTPMALNELLLNGFKTDSQNELLQALFNRGGMMSMMPTVIIIMLALSLGGLLTEQKILQSVMAPLVPRIKTGAGVITGTLFTGTLANFMIGEQYLATILPGQLWKESFDRVKLSRLALGRTLEDSGTVLNYLVPWGVAGSFAAQTLGVSVWAFAPFVFFAWLSPVFSLVSAWTGIGLKRVEN
ncbi:Na+/H+ antiporter NhaC family protein [Weissella tructae]|uniref:Na+:H+ antiporter NhaC n=2 Tax=Weissella TaxID=46255 RepID=A0A075TZR0_9LACO|nr:MULTISPECIES: Na+/H+ antiporter NhaC family protein [Weissella]AIG65810.1 Na+:H+ antiporter NhaC [Weissella tructae]AIM63189.1 Na+:H+ antiporter NhaC [Weissella ceti]AIM64524.2 Na+:H+ antiporter NhaC [Weissella ceti]ELA06738.1 Na+:H+ antiporter NhaC [Weissella ceti NC36]QVV90969.1 sodium:proton antiporter [Weissella tructae]